MFKVLLLALMLPISSFGAINQAVTPTPNRLMLVTPNKPQVSIVLETNPSTGYSWSVASFDKRLLTLKSHKILPNKSNMMGAPTLEQWIFDVNKTAFGSPKTTLVRFKYARPWDQTTGTYRVVRVLIRGNNP
jgi:predicted secreted protein